MSIPISKPTTSAALNHAAEALAEHYYPLRPPA